MQMYMIGIGGGAIKTNIERLIWINKIQIEIKEYYFTTNKGLIAWIKLEPHIGAEIHRRTVKAANVNFRSVTFIPKLARDFKAKIDKLLMEFQKEENDFRYLVCNGEEYIEIL